ncbi:hypothetical protein RBB77_13400 [Tunturibacter psychrotolerans]|uniref:Flagellar hook-length control protein FliK n=1 Tax=Tunturiibacter psychrotolerans TaxID=3069686 RepID=A0AAU7ZJT1_9BACT
MMSTAILMSMGAEQSTKRPVAQEVDKLEGPTFAQALDARVGIPSETVDKDSAAGAPPELRTTAEATAGPSAWNLEASVGGSAALVEKGSAAGTLPEGSTPKSELVTKNLIDVPELTAAGKAKTLAGQVVSSGGASKEIAGAKSSPSQTVAAAEPECFVETKDSGTQVAELSENTEGITGETLTGLPLAAASGIRTGAVNPVEGQRDENQVLIPSLETPVTSKGIAATGTAPETATAKKTIKTQGSDATAAVASKGGTTAVHAVTDEAKAAQGVVIQVPAPLSGHTEAYVASTVSHNAMSDGAADGTALVSAAASNTTSIAGTTSTADGSSHKNLVQSTKTPASNIETTPTASADPTGTAKVDVRAERSSAVTGNPAGDGDGKGRTAGESLGTSIHSVVSGSDLTSAAVPSGVTGLVKLPNGESGAQTSGLTTGLREQDGSGAVARSFESMPRTLSATPTALEVGIPDGTHGWLKVRAEMTDGGVVNASVSAASSASQEMLHRELPSLTAYLQAEKVAVNSVVVHPAAGTGTDSRGYSAGTESGANGQTPQGSNEGGEQRQSSVNAATEATEDVSSYQELRGVGEDGTLPLTVYEGGGSWLSVRA